VTRRPPDLPSLRAALWAARAVRHARRQLRTTAPAAVALPRLPHLPASAGRGVTAVLRRQPHTCLERALVLQRWRAEHGDPRDVVIGVRGPARSFSAHAWLEDEQVDPAVGPFEELLRVRP
jgi:Transglutaminase-like superfamily